MGIRPLERRLEARKTSLRVYQFRFLQLIIFAKLKQKTTHVDSDPRDGSDPEAVSGSSTKYRNFIQPKKAVF